MCWSICPGYLLTYNCFPFTYFSSFLWRHQWEFPFIFILLRVFCVISFVSLRFFSFVLFSKNQFLLFLFSIVFPKLSSICLVLFLDPLPLGVSSTPVFSSFPPPVKRLRWRFGKSILFRLGIIHICKFPLSLLHCVSQILMLSHIVVCGQFYKFSSFA